MSEAQIYIEKYWKTEKIKGESGVCGLPTGGGEYTPPRRGGVEEYHCPLETIF